MRGIPPWLSQTMPSRPVWCCLRSPLIITITLLAVFSSAAAQDFTLQSSQPLQLAPQLRHTRWIAQRLGADGGPGKPWDRLGLHRLLRRDLDPHQSTVVFFLPGMNSNAEQILADGLFARVADTLDEHPELPAQRLSAWRTELTGLLQRSTPHVLAEAGYAVYAMDYRTHFVPPATDPNTLSFMRHWGWAMFLDDIAAAIAAARQDSGAARVILAAESLGGLFALNYAACTPQDIAALVFIDGGDGNRVQLTPQTLLTLLGLPSSTGQDGSILMDDTILPGMLQHVVDSVVIPLLHATGTYATDMGEELATMQPAMWADPLARPKDPTTGRTLPQSTYVDWAAAQLRAVPFHLFTAPDQNTSLGLAGIWASFDRYFPLQILLESMDQLEFGLMAAGLNTRFGSRPAGSCPDGRPFVQGYRSIEVPAIGFLSHFGLTLWGPWNPQLGSSDVTLGGSYPEMGHLDMYIGTHTYPLISEPLLHWLTTHGFPPLRPQQAQGNKPDHPYHMRNGPVSTWMKLERG